MQWGERRSGKPDWQKHQPKQGTLARVEASAGMGRPQEVNRKLRRKRLRVVDTNHRLRTQAGCQQTNGMNAFVRRA